MRDPQSSPVLPAKAHVVNEVPKPATTSGRLKKACIRIVLLSITYAA